MTQVQDVPRALMEPPKNIGFRFGFIAILLVMITAIFPQFISIGVDDAQILSFQGMFFTGMIGTMFFSMLLRNSSKTSNDEGIVFSPKNINKQFAVLMVGLIAGLIMVVTNSLVYSGSNLLSGSIWGTIDPKAFYLGMLAGVAEELMFRGFIGTFLRLISPNLILAIVPSAAIFALFHYFAYWEPSAFVVLFALGIILGLIHEFTNDIGAPMLAHIINNTFVMMPAVMLLLTDNLFVIITLVIVFIVAIFLSSINRRK